MFFRTRSTRRRCSRSTRAPSAVFWNFALSSVRSACTPALSRANAGPRSVNAAGGDNMELMPRRGRRARRNRQNLVPCRGDQHRVFPLRREAVVLGDDGPAVGKLADRRLAGVDHRLDRESHSRLKASARSRTPVMQNLRLFVELAPDSMAAEFAHHAVAPAFGMLLDRRPDIAEKGPRAHRIDAEPHALVGGFAQPPRLDRGLADIEPAAGFVVKAVLDHRSVGIQNVTGFQHALPGNAVADLMIYGGADRLGKGLVAGRRVIEGGRDGFLLVNDELMTETVELTGGDAGLHPRGDDVEHPSPARLAEPALDGRDQDGVILCLHRKNLRRFQYACYHSKSSRA